MDVGSKAGAWLNPGLDDILSALELRPGVFRPDWGSFALADIAMGYSGRFLDMGTGSGFVTIALYLAGREGTASDVSPECIECAEQNFMNFGISPETKLSNLYSQISSKYDVVIYNPPKGSKETRQSRLMKGFFTKYLPDSAIHAFERVYHRLDRAERRKELLGFIELTRSRLNEGGIILMNILPSDAGWLSQRQGYDVSEKATSCRRSVVEIRYSA